MGCPTFETLIAFVEGTLDGAGLSAVSGHLASPCLTCASSTVWYRELRDLLLADRSVDPPPWLVSRAVALYDEAREVARRRGVAGLLVCIRAALAFDSFGPAPS